MKRTRTIPRVLLSICLVAVLHSQPRAEEKAPAPAGAIDAAAQVGSGHPEYEPGISCNDCHEVKYDAQTTATQVWLYEESPGKAKGEGVMPRERIWQEIVKAIGGVKHDSKTYVLGTSLNNIPLTTTCEWTLDPHAQVLYGFHEKGTEKLNHIAANPRVSMNYHKEFDSATFAGFLCVQIRGTAELIEGSDSRFEKIMIDLLPYEYGAQVPPDATPQQREERLRLFRQGVKGNFVISKIVPEQIVIANGDFRGEGYRVYQRWTRD
jgi:general stress protein 26